LLRHPIRAAQAARIGRFSRFVLEISNDRGTAFSIPIFMGA
jgi:hypothetical protein